VKVGSGMTTLVPGPTVTSRSASIASFEPFPARMPSARQPEKRARASSSSFGSKSG
jgi:hypothetical protein